MALPGDHLGLQHVSTFDFKGHLCMPSACLASCSCPGLPVSGVICPSSWEGAFPLGSLSWTLCSAAEGTSPLELPHMWHFLPSLHFW